MINTIVYSIFILIFFLFLVSNIKMRTKFMDLTLELFKTNVEKNIKIEELLKQLEQSKVDSNDDFLTFVSKSRDMAFEYIENVQTGILEFIDTVGPDIEYLDKYMPPIVSEEATIRLVSAYKKLKLLMPDDYGKINT